MRLLNGALMGPQPAAKAEPMTYHEALKPRRRPWLIATPLILVLVLGAVWTGVWFFAAGEAEKRMNAWREQQARAGRMFGCATQSVGGLSVPHRGALHRRDRGTEGHPAADRDQAEGDPGGRAGVGPETPDRGVHRTAHGLRSRASRPM